MARSGATEFRPDPAWFNNAMRSGKVQRLQEQAGRQVTNDARSSAPVDTGAYKNSIRMSSREARHRRVTIVEAADEKALLIESKTGNLARAAKRAKL